jgi:hypothetical protein
MCLRPALADVDLHEGAGFLRQFPRRSALAGGQADDHRADLAAFTGLESDVFRDIVALVEQAERRHPLRHRGRAAVIRLSLEVRCRCGRAPLVEQDAGRLRHTAAVTGGKARSADQKRTKAGKPHAASQLSALPGVQAS